MKNLMRPFLMLAALAILATAPAFADQLIINGGFEYGNLTGFSVSTSSAEVFASGPYDGYNPASGSYLAVLYSYGIYTELIQGFSDTPGTPYTFSFDYASGGGVSVLTAQIDGNTVLDIFSGDSGKMFNQYTFGFVGSGGDYVDFIFQNDSIFDAYDALDNVSVTSATPEPSSLVLLGTGILSFAGAARRRFRKA